MQQESQCEQILEYLQEHATITPEEARVDFQCTRLAARILELRRRGQTIGSRRYRTPGGAIVAQYYLPLAELGKEAMAHAS